VQTRKRRLIWIFLIPILLMVVFSSFSPEHQHGDSQRISALADEAQPDSCDVGYCHLGHCGGVILPQVLMMSFEIHKSPLFSFHPENPPERSLESPFQPPRSV
jgi:hypothetical protein